MSETIPTAAVLLIGDEIARREQKKLQTRLRRANFRTHKTLEDFDFDFNPKINRALIQELASARFIDEKVAVLIAGPCGTGKSHLAQALGHRPGICQVGGGGTVVRAVVFFPVLHEQAAHGISLIPQQHGGDRRVDAAG